MKTSIYNESLDYKFLDPVIIEWEKKRKEEEERKKNPNGPFTPLYAPNPNSMPYEDPDAEPEEEEKPKRVIIIEYD